MNAENILLKDILDNSTLYEVYEDENNELQYKLKDGKKIKICEIYKVDYNPIAIFNYDLKYITKISKYLGLNESEQISLENGDTPLFTASMTPVSHIKNDTDILKLISKSNNKIISFATNGDGSAGRNFIIHETDFFLNADRIAIQATNKMYYKYLYFSIMDMRKKHGYNRDKKAIDKNLRNDIIVNIPEGIEVNKEIYSSIDLQKSIAKNIKDKFNKLDTLIHFHKSSINLIKDSIGIFLDDIFSNKSTYSLNKLIREKSNKNINNKIDLVYSVTNSKGIIPESEKDRIIDSSADKSNYKVIEKYNFAFNPSRINVGSIGMLTRNDLGVVSPIYDVFSIDEEIINPYYFEYYLQSNIFKKNVKKYFLNAVRPKLDFEDLLKFKISIVFDSNKEKNKKIQEKELKNIKDIIDSKNFKIKTHNTSIILLNKQKEEIIKSFFGENQ